VTAVAATAFRSVWVDRGTVSERSPPERTVISPVGSRRAPCRTDHTRLQISTEENVLIITTDCQDLRKAKSVRGSRPSWHAAIFIAMTSRSAYIFPRHKRPTKRFGPL